MTPPAQRSEAWVGALVVLAVGSVVALAVGQSRQPPKRAPAASMPAAQVALPLLGGGQSALPRGKVTRVDFGATWCAPCRVSMPRLQRVWQEYRPSGVEIYSVDTDDPGPDRAAQVREFLLQNRLDFPVVLDDGEASRAFSVASLPTLVLLDKQGKVAWSHVGALAGPHETDLRAALDRALGR